MQVEESYASDVYAPAAARDLCRRVLDLVLGDSPVVEDAALVVTELTTNALRAGTGRVVVTVAVDAEHVRIVVTDDAEGKPQVQDPTPLSARGRGLQIVSALASRWGTADLPHGKQVWAELSLP